MPTEKMQAADRIKDQLDRMYDMTGPYQWVRELLVNAFQAKAKNVLVTTDWVGVEEAGVYRRMIVDDGEGMNAADLKGFFNRYGGSGRPIGRNWGNKGFGAKVSLLPWNLYGMVVIARSGDGETNLIWMHEDTVQWNDYGLRMFDLSDDPAVHNWEPVVPLHDYEKWFSGDDGINWAQVAERALGDRKTGCAVILLGNSKIQNTVLGNTDPGRNETTKYGIGQFFSNKFFRQLPGVKVLVETYQVWTDTTGKPNPALWPKKQADLKGTPQAVTSMEEAIKIAGGKNAKKPTRTLQTGELIIPRGPDVPVGVKIAWHLTSDPMEANENWSGNRGDLVGFPMVGIVHTMTDPEHLGVEEVFDLQARGMAGVATSSSGVYKGLMSRFIKVQKIAIRLALVLTPIEDADVTVFADDPRRELFYSVGKGISERLPMDAWISYWATHLPPTIQAAIDKYYEELTRDVKQEDINYKGLGARYLKHLQATLNRLIPAKKPSGLTGIPDGDGDAKVAGSGGGGGGGGGGGNKKKAAVVTHIESTDTKAVPVEVSATRAGLVEVVFETDPTGDWAVKYDPSAKIAVVNDASRSYRRIQLAVIERYQNSGKLDDLDYTLDSRWGPIKAGMDAAVKAHVSLAVTEVLQEANEHQPANKTKLLDEVALSNVLKGIKGVEEMATSYIAELLKGRKTTKAA